ncbi:MAG: GGDEF domain-containing protein, partial [Candidatus Cloacimonetes bacterium]|nr:GGDEF domain-containing protein [Candidatus Cloacimonadota bacterium]
KYENEKDQVSRQIIFRNTFMIASLILLNIVFIFFNRYRTKLQAHKELEEAHDKLEQIASKDPLTNLSNRRDMKEKIMYEKSRFERSEKPFVIIMSDIDFFKQVNDEYGHDCGDYVLKTISDIFLESIRKQDIVGRWGGEEFILLLPETNLKGGKIVAEKIRKKIYKTEFKYQKNKIPVRMTFGVTIIKPFQEINDCIIEADKALYDGKRNGRNRVVLTE